MLDIGDISLEWKYTSAMLALARLRGLLFYLPCTCRLSFFFFFRSVLSCFAFLLVTIVQESFFLIVTDVVSMSPGVLFSFKSMFVQSLH